MRNSAVGARRSLLAFFHSYPELERCLWISLGILQVMARILQFDEDAQRQVGLTSTGWSGYLPFGLGSAHSSGLRTADANDGQNIADEWAEFLLAEARGGGPG